MQQKRNILCFKKDEIKRYFEELNEPGYRTGQLFSWLHQKHADNFDMMSDFTLALRRKLNDDLFIDRIRTVKKLRSADGTVKYLFALFDGNCIESVAMFYKHGVSVCISTQAGCRMGCVFCASAKGGLKRNLTVSEMLLQVYEISRDLDKRVDSIVLMGMGEPFDNFCNVMDFCDIISDSEGMNLSARSISISTSGIVDGINLLAKSGKQYTLSVSLHATTDETRSRLMPVNNGYGIESLMESCRRYKEKTGRRVSFEYAVINGVNDSRKDAERLAGLIRGMDAHINLIPVNSSDGNYSSSRKDARLFGAKLESLGVNVTVRRTLGQDIEAACGQLRNRVESELEGDKETGV